MSTASIPFTIHSLSPHFDVRSLSSQSLITKTAAAVTANVTSSSDAAVIVVRLKQTAIIKRIIISHVNAHFICIRIGDDADVKELTASSASDTDNDDMSVTSSPPPFPTTAASVSGWLAIESDRQVYYPNSSKNARPLIVSALPPAATLRTVSAIAVQLRGPFSSASYNAAYALAIKWMEVFGDVNHVNATDISKTPPSSLPLLDHPLCAHGQLTVKRVWRKPGANHGREYYCCTGGVGYIAVGKDTDVEADTPCSFMQFVVDDQNTMVT